MAVRKTPAEKAAEALVEVEAKIQGFPAPFAELGTRMHELIMHANPQLKPRIWYGMPGYALAASKPVLVFFRCDEGVFSMGISEKANISLPPGASDRLISSSWFLHSLDETTEQRIISIVQRATWVQ
ncbi:hypothetical protein COCCU_08640 [Corynebacterium occultum]|uniref:YdhG-like domain-containing protein n=1 Tax=Corynebacterium occultum TaxID=2675219 RepID=A0A6B8VPZ4_9CORY|nr:DUF1801 domain-containing protein [Corynebacterium occultum]QGU07652.1 hypothetical protein COCCU_08640 [Corynebacterium occultum]